jgi:hypothetical protein
MGEALADRSFPQRLFVVNKGAVSRVYIRLKRFYTEGIFLRLSCQRQGALIKQGVACHRER